MIRSEGHCNTMGTASTMGCLAEALGATLPGVAGIPAPDARLLQAAQSSGRRIVGMVEEDLRPSTLLTRGSFLNAIVALAGALRVPLLPFSLWVVVGKLARYALVGWIALQI